MNARNLTIYFVTLFLIQQSLSCFSRTTGLYIKTLAKIIQDLTQFIAVFIVIFLPSRCALFLSLRQGSNQRLW